MMSWLLALLRSPAATERDEDLDARIRALETQSAEIRRQLAAEARRCEEKASRLVAVKAWKGASQ